MRLLAEHLKKVTKIITHANCADGVASAIILHKVLPEASIEFVSYDSLEHLNLKAEPGLLFCDFSPPKTRTSEFLEAGSVILDHHLKAQWLVQSFIDRGLGVFAHEKLHPGVSGADLAFQVWEVLSPDQNHRSEVERLATLAGIRDTWQTSSPDWVRACEQGEALTFFAVDELLQLDPSEWASKLSIGTHLYSNRLKAAKRCSEKSHRFTTPLGHKVAVFQGISQSSDTAEYIGKEADICIGFGFTMDETKPGVKSPSLSLSCRSRGTFDVGAMASALGGGGHTSAAGFRVILSQDSPQPYRLIQEIIEDYEKGHLKR